MTRPNRFAILVRQTLRRIGHCLGLMLVLLGASSMASALPPPPVSTPEIDPGSAASAVAILAGSMLILNDRLRRK